MRPTKRSAIWFSIRSGLIALAVSIPACQDTPTTPLRAAAARLALSGGTYVLSLPTNGSSVDNAVLNWTNAINGDCSSSVVGLVAPGTYDITNEILINSCATSVTLEPQQAGTVTFVQRGVHSGHADNGFHVESANVTVEGFTVESTAQPVDYGPFAGAGIRFEQVSSGAALGNRFLGMQSAGVDSYNSSHITINNNFVTCVSPLTSQSDTNSMGLNIRSEGQPSYVTVENNHVENCYEEGISVEAISNVHVAHDTILCTGNNHCTRGIALAGRRSALANGCVQWPTNDSYVGYSLVQNMPGSNDGILEGVEIYGNGMTLHDTVENSASIHVRLHGIAVHPEIQHWLGGCEASYPAYEDHNGYWRQYTVLHNNYVNSPGQFGIWIGGMNTIANGNYVDSAGTLGIYIDPTGSADTLQASQVRWTTGVGVGIFVGSGTGSFTFANTSYPAQPSKYVFGNNLVANTGFGLCYSPTNTILWNAYSGNGHGNLATVPWSWHPGTDPSNCH